MAAQSPPCDQAILARPGIRQMYARSYAEATRPGVRGFAWEGILFSRPWGFRLEEISVEVHLWHGEEDASTPLAMAQYVAGAIPNCQARFLPGEGHALFLERWQEILGVLMS
jgi:pimeloyl-ACP methyl ester carboxylesterase